MYKKRFLRLVSAVLALCMMAALLPTAAFAADPLSPGTTFSYPYQGQTLKYIVNADGTTVSVAAQGKDVVSGDVVIPETVEHDGKTYTVTSIGNGAFSWCKSLTNVTIPSSVTSIGNGAFYGCDHLTSVEIPSSVTSIGAYAFSECSKLERVTIPSSVTSIGAYAFSDCSALENVTFADAEKSQLASIGDNAFSLCESLTSVTIPSSVTSIGAYAFSECSALESVTIPASVTRVGSDILANTAPKIIYGGTEADWKNIKASFPEDSKVQYMRHTVKFMNGEDEVKSITADYNSTIAVNDAPVAPVKEGYEFGGWYSGSEKFVFGETKVTSDLTLTAKWTKPIFYDITVKNGTTNVASAKKGDLIKLYADEAPEGEAFDYWKVNGAKIEGDSFEMPAENVTAEAVYKAKTYTVVFVTDRDNTPNSLTVKHGETISGDRILKADGYEFGGWYNGTEKFVFGENGTKVTGNLTLTARWTEVKKPDPTPEPKPEPKPEPEPEPKPDPEPVVYEIVVDNGTAYLDDGATAIHTAEEGQTVILKVNPEALTEGFAFDKWEIVSGDVKLADETASETTFEMPASDVELKATVKSIEPAAEPLTGLEQAALLTTGTVVAGAGVAAVGFAAYGIGVELYAQALLPAGAALPTNCGELAVLVWNMAGKPQPALPAEGLTDAQTALLWAAESGLLPAQAGATPEDPEHPVSAREVVRALRKARSLAPKG